MRVLTKPFTDVYGNTFDAAVLVATDINVTSSSSRTLVADIVSGVVQYVEHDTPSQKYVGFRVLLYKDSASLVAGKLPMTFRTANLQEYFNLQDTPPAVDSMPALELAELLEDYIITDIIK